MHRGDITTTTVFCVIGGVTGLLMIAASWMDGLTTVIHLAASRALLTAGIALLGFSVVAGIANHVVLEVRKLRFELRDLLTRR